MKVLTRLFWSGALILILISAACAPGEETTPTPFETTAPLETDTPSGTETTETATTETAATSETLEVTGTATTSGTAVGSPTSETLTPGIPITGLDVSVVDCQFCVADMAHALLIMPDTNSFTVVSTASTTTTTVTPTCTTVEVSNGQQVVLCNGSESVTLMVNVCNSSGTCADVPVDLMECPEVPGSGTDAATNTPGTVPGAATATPSPSGLGTATVTPTP